MSCSAGFDPQKTECIARSVTIWPHGVNVVIASGAKQSRLSPVVRWTEDCFPAERGISLLAMTQDQRLPHVTWQLHRSYEKA